MEYETDYVIVAGVAWIRRTRVETSSSRVEEGMWLTTFDGDQPESHKADAGTMSVERGEIGGSPFPAGAWPSDVRVT